MTVLLVVGCCIAYGLIGTLAGVAAYTRATDINAEHSCLEMERWGQCHGYGHRLDGEVRGLFVGAFWPVGLWFLLAWALIDRRERARSVLADRRRLLAEAMAELDGERGAS